jgi:hypothetical protein
MEGVGLLPSTYYEFNTSFFTTEIEHTEIFAIISYFYIHVPEAVIVSQYRELLYLHFVNIYYY